MPAVLTTDEFSAALAQGYLDGTTVRVTGAVEPVDWKSGPVCTLPPATCVLGQLVSDAEPPIIVSAYRFQVREEDDHATYSGESVTWAWWAGPDAPVDGTLVLSVTQDYRKVIFLGVAREGGSGNVWSVAAAAAINVESLGQEEVVLIDGWLTGIDYPLFCPLSAHPRLDGLPSNDWCSNGAWLMSDAMQLNPSNFSIPPDSIRVQSGAFDEFAPEPGLRDGREVVPQHGIFAIAKRLFGGGRGEEPPFWAWAIVGRIGN
jgi:hypothetical protein